MKISNIFLAAAVGTVLPLAASANCAGGACMEFTDQLIELPTDEERATIQDVGPVTSSRPTSSDRGNAEANAVFEED